MTHILFVPGLIGQAKCHMRVDPGAVLGTCAGKIYPLAEAAQAVEDSLKVGRGAKLYLEG